MSTITKSPEQAKAELMKNQETARRDAQRKWAAFERKREEVIASGVDLTEADTQTSAAFEELDSLHTAYEDASERHSQVSAAMNQLFGTDANGRRPVEGAVVDVERHGANAEAVAELTARPGVLLASMLERRRRDIASLPEQIRYAQSTPITTNQVDSAAESAALIDLLAPLSVALASGIQTLRMSTTKTRVPRFTELPNAAWIAELGNFPKNGPGIEMIDVEPPKVGLITEVSIEVFEDLSPLVLGFLQLQMLRAIALEFDRGILFGSGSGATPLGVANTPGIQAVTGVKLTSLAAFAKAIADLIAVNAKPGALYMNPGDVGKLIALTESVDGAGSNVPLWKASIGSASGLRLPYFDIPIWPTPACPANRAVLADPATIIAAIRREADISIDPYYGFGNGVVGLRTYLRGEPVVGQPDGTVTIEFTP